MELINRTQTKNYITDQLKQTILSGKLKPGEELVQENIAAMLGVSRMPVREALQMLEQEGFLIRLPNRHMVVADIKDETIITLFKVLSAIEYQVIQGIIENKKDTASVLEAYQQYEISVTAAQITQSIEKEIEVHIQLSEVLENQYLKKIHHSFLRGYFAYARKLSLVNQSEFMQLLVQSLETEPDASFMEALEQYFLSFGTLLAESRKEQQSE